MRLLLDTHVFLWLAGGGKQLSKETVARLEDPENTVYVSAVTAWEIAIKQALGKLSAPNDLSAELGRLRLAELPITIEHATAVRDLPLLHADSFDRLLIAQASVEGLHLVTSDSAIAQYGIKMLPG